MTRYVLDTSALVDYSLGHEPVLTRIVEMLTSHDEVAISSVQVAEFYSGLAPSERPRWQLFFESLSVWETGQLAAQQPGIYRYDYSEWS